MVNMTGDPYYAKYDLFRINDEIDYYRLSVVGNYSGTAGSFESSFAWNFDFLFLYRVNHVIVCLLRARAKNIAVGGAGEWSGEERRGGRYIA